MGAGYRNRMVGNSANFDDSLPARRVRVVGSFKELVGAAFEGEVNALCWRRELEGDFGEVAAAIGEERGTIEDVIEPYLIQQGFLMRTPRGRMATQTAYQHLGLKAPARPGLGSAIADMFDSDAS